MILAIRTMIRRNSRQNCPKSTITAFEEEPIVEIKIGNLDFKKKNKQNE